MQPAATIIFSTHNRGDLLRQAIVAAQKQSVPVRILVMDDASNDGTQQMMEKEFPEIEYHRSSENLGPCYQRNRGIELATTEIVFPLDDDSTLQSPYTIEQTLAEFDDDRVGAVAIPYSNILQSNQIHTQAPDKRQIYLIHAFVAASHAIRRSVFFKAGKYREVFFYMGEEGDLSIRMLKHGFFVRLGTADPIHHFQPPNRISVTADIYGRQNDILFAYINTPALKLPFYLLGTTINGILFGIQEKRLGNMLEGIKRGYKLTLTKSGTRDAVPEKCFQLFRRLKHCHFVPLSEVEHYLK
jgi:glycosyltransferase involved in cell wall biosynthesis